MKGRIGTILLTAAAVLLIGYLFIRNSQLRNQASRSEQRLALQEAYNDSLRTSFNQRTGEWESERLAFIAERRTLDQFLEEKDSELAELRNRGASTGVIIDTETNIDTLVINDTISVDTAIRVARINRLPHYEAEVTSYPDSTRLKLSAFLTLRPTIDEKTGMLSVTHNNPVVTVTGLEGFQVRQPQKKKNWKWWAGIAIGAGGTYLILK